MGSGNLRGMADLAHVIPFPLSRASAVEQPRPPEPGTVEDYWALVQRLRAERRRLAADAG